MDEPRTADICATECTSGCHASDCEHHGHLPAARAEVSAAAHAVFVALDAIHDDESQDAYADALGALRALVCDHDAARAEVAEPGEEHCCNDPSHMSAGYLSGLSATAGREPLDARHPDASALTDFERAVAKAMIAAGMTVGDCDRVVDGLRYRRDALAGREPLDALREDVLCTYERNGWFCGLPKGHVTAHRDRREAVHDRRQVAPLDALREAAMVAVMSWFGAAESEMPIHDAMVALRAALDTPDPGAS